MRLKRRIRFQQIEYAIIPETLLEEIKALLAGLEGAHAADRMWLKDVETKLKSFEASE